MKIITRRYIAQVLPAGSGRTITIDVNTGEGVSESQAMTTAQNFARKKLKAKSIRVFRSMRTDSSLYTADYSIGPKPKKETKLERGIRRTVVKSARKNTREQIAWAENEVVRILDHITPGQLFELIQEKVGKPAQVNVFIKGGVIHDIEFPAGVAVTVYDYDVEGVEPERIEKDGKGDDCVITNWANA